MRNSAGSRAVAIGCNCGKNKTPPAGSGAKAAAVTSGNNGAKITPASAAQAGTSTPVQRPTQQSFVSTLRSDAARVRAKGQRPA